jgi:hypothetical protein
MLLLEFFCGTNSIACQFEAEGWEVVSVDIDPSCKATWTADVRDFDAAALPRRPDFIWASPSARIIRSVDRTPRRLEWADSLRRRAGAPCSWRTRTARC